MRTVDEKSGGEDRDGSQQKYWLYTFLDTSIASCAELLVLYMMWICCRLTERLSCCEGDS